ncbi:CidA/LrgA family protein [Virgibacillus natechei]|nr:CidA/LrgA family protein [Virgibacillus natechei]UZD12826.1 CidA/LrgA family protein [Virgibacillus natechei]
MLKVMKAIIHIAVLYVIYELGSWIQRAFDLLIPGSVIGMVLLFILLMTGIVKVTWVEEGARFFINHLTLFYIPVTVGIINYFYLFAGWGFLLVIIALVSTMMVMATSGYITQLLVRTKELDHD